MSQTTLLLLVSLSLCMVFITAIYVWLKLKSFKSLQNILTAQIQSNELLISDIQSSFASMQKNIEELTAKDECYQNDNNMISKQLEHRIKIIQQEINDVKAQLEHIQAQQPEDKLYSRALKMAKLGADVDEIVQECEIPRAEAEMLLSVHHKTKN